MAKEQYVFESEGKIIRYRFPTHINDLIIPREESTCAEVFMVVLDENEAPPLHKHDDAEQIFYMIALFRLRVLVVRYTKEVFLIASIAIGS